MALPSEQSSVSYTGNASTVTPYPIPFKFFDASDIVVIVTDLAGVSSTLVLNVDYAVSGGDPEAGATGSLTTTVAIPATSTVLVERTVEITQDTVYTDIGKFPSSSIDHSLDKLTMIDQQLDRAITENDSAIQPFARLPLATQAETVAGVITNQATSPDGVAYAIEQAALTGYPIPLSVANGGTGGTTPATAIQSLLANPASFTLGTPATVNFVFEGDSLTTDVSPPSGAGNDWPQQAMLLSRFVGQGTYNNVATSSNTLANIDSQYASQVYPLRPTGSIIKSYLFLEIGTNDPTVSASSWLTNWNSYIDRAIADGFTVFVGTIMRATTNIDFETNRQAKNLGIRSRTGVTLIDWDLLFPSPYDTTFFVDGIHPNSTGCLILARQYNSAMESVGNPAYTPNPAGINITTFFGPQRVLPLGPVGSRNVLLSDGTTYYNFPNGVPSDPGTGGYSVGFRVRWVSGEAYIVGRSSNNGYGVTATGAIFYEGGGRTGRFTSTYLLQPHVWYHIVFSRESTSVGMRISVNGVAIDLDTTATGSAGAPFQISLQGGAHVSYFNDVFYYTKGLQRGEVERIYQNGGAPVDSVSLAWYFPCDEGAGYQAQDRSANNRWIQAQNGAPSWAVPPHYATTVFLATFAHSAISATAATTALLTLPKNTRVASIDWNFTVAFDAAVTLDIGVTGTSGKYVSAQAASGTGLFFSDSASKAIESTSATTQVWIKKSGATTVGAVLITVILESIGLSQ